MRFLCPSCASPDGLEILAGLEVGADARSDEIRLQVLACRACGARFAGVYEESRRGALDAESWHHDAVRLPAEALDVVAAAIDACPEPDDDGCSCAGHEILATRDERGVWDALARLQRGEAVATDRLRPARQAPLEAAIRWTSTRDVEVPYRAVVDGEEWTLGLGDFPEGPLYTLRIGEAVVVTLSDWPARWLREPRPA